MKDSKENKPDFNQLDAKTKRLRIVLIAWSFLLVLFPIVLPLFGISLGLLWGVLYLVAIIVGLILGAKFYRQAKQQLGQKYSQPVKKSSLIVIIILVVFNLVFNLILSNIDSDSEPTPAEHIARINSDYESLLDKVQQQSCEEYSVNHETLLSEFDNLNDEHKALTNAQTNSDILTEIQKGARLFRETQEILMDKSEDCLGVFESPPTEDTSNPDKTES